MSHTLIKASWIVCLTLLASVAVAEELQRTISVTGQGKATAPPDMATIHVGVVTQAADAKQALEANNRSMENVIAVLKRFKIAAKDIQTSGFDLQPQYKRERTGQQEMTGYRAMNRVQVRVRNLPDLGEVLDALVAAGSNQVSGISFGIDEPTGVLNQARNRAISDARSRAELYAQAAGVGVGQVLTISEQSFQLPQPRYMARASMAEAAAVPIATGEQEFQVSIQVVFELVDK